MSYWVNFLNVNSPSWLFNQAWPMVWQSSLLIVLAAVASRIVLRKASAQLRYGLWCIVLLRLVLPPTLDVPTSIGHWGTPVIQRHAPSIVQAEQIQPAISQFMRQTLQADAPPPAMPPVSSARLELLITPTTVVLLLWLTAALALTIVLAARILCFHGIMRRASPASGELAGMVDLARAQMRVRRPVAALITQLNVSPAVYGLFRPTILLPRNVVAGLENEQIYSVIVHELAHIKRRDYLVNWIQIALGIVYFFHPLLWYANRRLRIEREQACDDLTLVTLGLDRGAYAASLVSVAERLLVARQFAPAHVGVVETKSHLGHRLRRILNKRLRPAPRLTRLGAGVIFAFAAVFGTWHHTLAESQGVESLSMRIKIVDESGVPVEGASVMPNALRAKVERSSAYGWREEVHGKIMTVQTDEKGTAQLQYPRYVEEHRETGTVAVSVWKTAFVSQRTEFEVDGSSPPFVLEQAATVRVSGYIGREENIVWPVHALMDVQQVAHDKAEWSPVGDGKQWLENSTVKDGTHYLWLAHQSSDQGWLFSQSQEITAQKGKALEVALPLEPGCRLEGKLDDSVPRPVNNGVAEIRVMPNELVAGPEQRSAWVQWIAQSPIQEDGTFVFESLPMGHAEIAAYCDGAFVKYPAEGPPKGLPQPFPTQTSGSLVTGVVVPMQPTATAVIVVENPDGQLLPGAKVSFWPNLFWFDTYSTIAAPAPVTTEQSLQMDWKTEETASYAALMDAYSATTDETGKAVVGNLPVFDTHFVVQHESFQMPILQAEWGARRFGTLELKPGETTETRVRMEPEGASFLGETTASAPEAKVPAAPACVNEEQDPFAIPTTSTTPTNKLEGQVVDEEDNPLAGVNVDIWTWCTGLETQTDNDGRFSLSDLDKNLGTVEVRFSKKDYSFVHMFRQPIGRMARPVVMNNKTYFEGTVTDSSGKPIPNAMVRADGGPRQAEGVYIGDTTTEVPTNNDGAYRFYVQDGTYTVTVLAGEEMKVVPGVAINKYEAKKLDIQLAPAPVFRAQIVDSTTKQPVAGVRLKNWRWEKINGVSDANGMVTIVGIPGNQFEFDVEGADVGVVRWWSDEATKQWQRFTVENNWQRNFDSLEFKIAPNTEPVTIIVEQGVRIRGTVVNPDGEPVAGATVAPARTGTGNSLTGDTRFSVTTDSEGKFDMLLPASKTSEYNLIAHDGAYDEWRDWANGVMDPITTQPGDVMEGVVLKLRPPCEVRGRAVDEHGEPVADREVRACAFELNDNRYYVPKTRTDNNGSFILNFVAPGKHYVQVAPFWLKPTEAPEGTSQVVEATPGKPLEGIALIAKPE